MTAALWRARYRRFIAPFEVGYVRRYSGTGVGRTSTDYGPIRLRVVGLDPAELIGGIVQGDRKFIALAEDVTASGVALPIVATADKLVVRGREVVLKKVDDNTRRLGDGLVAYELVAGG